MIKPLTQNHLRAFNTRDQTAAGLLLRADYCDFMACTSPSENSRLLWEISGRRRRTEAAKKEQAQ